MDLIQHLQERVSEPETYSNSHDDGLYDSETRLKAIFDQTQQFTSLLQSDGHILEINRTALEFAGLRRQDVLGQALWETVWWQLGDCAAELENAFQQSLTGKTIQYETQMWGQDNVVATLDMILKPIMNHKNQVAMILVEGHDITERKIAEEQIHAALEKEKELNKLKSRFITFTSHEFRTPLAIIASSAYLLRRHGLNLSDEVQAQHFDKIQE
ncbi:MAG: PAS domain S-box protein [Anaerolineae bacterium]|nr:PAS domain S-box protein [Anaerolineae bacterium]